MMPPVARAVDADLLLLHRPIEVPRAAGYSVGVMSEDVLQRVAGGPLSAAFFRGGSEQLRRRLSQERRLEKLLHQFVCAGREAWPAIAVSEAVFVRYLADRVQAAEEPLAALRELHVGDLYLACGCACRNPGALDAFYQRYYRAGILRPLQRLDLAAAQCEEIAQSIVLELLDPKQRQEPLIERYGGRGSLAGWLKVIAVRHAMRSIRRDRRHGRVDESLEVVASPEQDIELRYMKRYYRKAFKQAFLRAIAGLDDRQVTLLRQHYVGGVTTRQLGSIYRVHQTTAARWLRQAEEELQCRTRDDLVNRLQLHEQEYPSIIRLIESQMAQSICQVFVPKNGARLGEATSSSERGSAAASETRSKRIRSGRRPT
jgi:RNA polymerase sigma-70 factor (ECF subfamily)